jgi:hypothetical protein
MNTNNLYLKIYGKKEIDVQSSPKSREMAFLIVVFVKKII